MADDYSADIHTTANLTVGGTATGEIESERDSDWFAVELIADRTYTIAVEGAGYEGGTLAHTVLRGVHDSEGNMIRGARDRNNDETPGRSEITFTATESATHYVNAQAKGRHTGTYTVSVIEVTDDYSADIHTTANLTVGGTATGEIESERDSDWFAVELIADRTYTIAVEGAGYEGGTLAHTVLRGVHDSEGNMIRGARDRNNDETPGRSEITFTATESATHYVNAQAKGRHTGTYTVSVIDATPDLGDITDSEAATATITLDGTAGAVTYRKLTLTEEQTVTIELTGLDANADLAIENAAGDALHASRETGTTDESITAALAAGTYYVRIEARESGANTLEMTYAASTVETAQATSETETEYTEAELEALKLSSNEDDFSAAPANAGAIEVGGTATGEVEVDKDIDWFAVTLEKGKAYRIEVKGSPTEDGTLADAYIHGVHDAQGEYIGGTTNDDGGHDRNAKLLFIAPEAGTHYVAAGGFHSRYFERTGTYQVSVTELPDDFIGRTGTSATVTVGESAEGTIDYNGDSDWFAVTLEAGVSYQIDLKGVWNGHGTLGNPEIEGVHDANGAQVFDRYDWHSASGTNERRVFTPSEGGTYYVNVTAEDGGTGTYELSVSERDDDFGEHASVAGTVEVGGTATGAMDFYEDHDWFAVDLIAGETYRIDLQGSINTNETLDNPDLIGVRGPDGAMIEHTANRDGGLSDNAQTTFTATQTGTHHIVAGASRRSSEEGGTYRVAVTAVEDHEDDYSADTGTTGAATVGAAVTGTLEYAGDRDWFAVELQGGIEYDIEVAPRGSWTGGDRNPHLHGIYDSEGVRFAGTSAAPGGPRDSAHETFTAPETGTYYIAAGQQDLPWSGIGEYQVVVVEAGTPLPLAAGTVEVGSSITGSIDEVNDRDWVDVVLEANTRYEIALEGAATSAGTLTDPVIYGVYHPNGTKLWRSGDDDGGRGKNSLSEIMSTQGGTYRIEVGGDEFFGRHTGTYTLSVTSMVQTEQDEVGATAVEVGQSATGEIQYVGDRDRFSVELEAGKVYQIRVEGSPTDQGTLEDTKIYGVYAPDATMIPDSMNDNDGETRNSSVTITAETAGTYEIEVGGYEVWPIMRTGTYTVSVTEVADEPTADEDSTAQGTGGEPGEDETESTTVEVGSSATGTIETEDDRDQISVELEAGKTYYIKLEGSATGKGTLTDPKIYGVYKPNGTLIPGSINDDHGGSMNSMVMIVADTAGTYKIEAGAYEGWNVAHRGTYTLSVAEDFDDFDDFEAGTDTTGEVTVGGTATGTLDFDGDIDWIKVTLDADSTYQIDVKGDVAQDWGGTLHNPSFTVYDANGDVIPNTYDDNGGTGRNARLEGFSPDTDGTYYIEIADPGGIGTYTVSVEETLDVA